MDRIFEILIFCNIAAILRPFFGHFWEFWPKNETKMAAILPKIKIFKK